MNQDMKKFLDYLFAVLAVPISIFIDSELLQILSHAIKAGKSNELSKTELKVLDSMIFKWERVLASPDIVAAQ